MYASAHDSAEERLNSEGYDAHEEYADHGYFEYEHELLPVRLRSELEHVPVLLELRPNTHPILHYNLGDSFKPIEPNR